MKDFEEKAGYKSGSNKTLKFLLGSEGSLLQKTIRGGLWVFAFRFVDRFFRFGRTIVLARLISPNDFGLFGVVLIALSTLDAFSRPGIRAALIQRKEATRSYTDTAWTIEVIRGLSIATALFFLSPYIANFFKAPDAEPILKIIGLVVVLHGLTNIAVVHFEKELKFNKFFVYQSSGTIVDVVVTVVAALLLRNVWALVFGLLAGHFVRLVVSYILDSYRPKLRFSKSEAKVLFGFGKWILGSNILNFVITQGDSIFVGRLLGATSLGFYQMAFRISNLPTTEVTQVISRITFPAYSKIQDKLPKLREAYLKVLQLTSFLSFPIAGLIFILASDFTMLFLGEKWMSIVPIMQVLVFAGLFRSLIGTGSPIFPAIGKPKITTHLQFFHLFLIVVLVYPLTLRLGVLGASLAVAFSALVFSVLFSLMVIKTIRCTLKQLIQAITFPLVNTIITALLVFGLKSTISLKILEFTAVVLGGVLTYILMTWVAYKFFNYRTPVIIKESFQALMRG